MNSGLSQIIIRMINNQNYIFPDFNSEKTVIYQDNISIPLSFIKIVCSCCETKLFFISYNGGYLLIIPIPDILFNKL